MQLASAPVSAGGPPTNPQLPDDRLADPNVVDNVDSLVETVRNLLASEDSRDQSFNARGVGLAGFVGIIVSLTTTVGRDALRADLTESWRIACITLFGAALLLLLATVFVVVRGVLTPQGTKQIGLDEVERYPLPEFIYRPKVMNQGRTLRGLVETLGVEREVAKAKARSLRIAYRTLTAGLACIAALGFILGLSDAKVIPHDLGRSTELRLCLGQAGHAAGAAARDAVTIRASCP